MFRKLMLLFSARENRSDALAASLAKEGDRLWRSVSAEEGCRVQVMRLVPGEADKTPHARMLGYDSGAFDAVLEIGYEDADLGRVVGLCEGLAARLGTLIDAGESHALAGTEYVFSPGDMPYALLVFMGRSLAVDYEDFHRYWLNRHGWLVKPFIDAGGIGYRQFHADPKASSLAARLTGVGRHEFEGTAQAYFPDVDAYVAGMSDPESLAHVLEDEKKFIRPEDTAVGLYGTVLQRARAEQSVRD